MQGSPPLEGKRNKEQWGKSSGMWILGLEILFFFKNKLTQSLEHSVRLNAEALKKAFIITITRETSHLDKSELNALVNRNVCPISINFGVFHFDKSALNKLAEPNVSCNEATEDVSHLLISELKAGASLNVLRMPITFEVSLCGGVKKKLEKVENISI